MKRSSLKRRTPLTSRSVTKRSPMRTRKGSTKYARRARDTERMAWIKRFMPCYAAYHRSYGCWYGSDPDQCSGPIEAHHAGVRGLSQKAPDDTCIPLCSHHHRCLTDRSGCFAGWPRGNVKEWELAVVDHCQHRYELYKSRSVF